MAQCSHGIDARGAEGRNPAGDIATPNDSAALEHPGTAYLAWNTLDCRALGSVKCRHDQELLTPAYGNSPSRAHGGSGQDASGHEGDSALTGFAVRGNELVVYIAADFEGRDALLAKLGKHKTGKVCVYIRRLANVDLKVLETLVARSVADTRHRYLQGRN